MLDIVFCEECRQMMIVEKSTRKDGGKLTKYQCLNCGFSFEEGFRLNKVLHQFIKYIKIY